ncbi:hypothetical protein L6452_10676 [Arctium lappa]|uniref:Uncharacterized protein n=1 Tax=Arctium lappa TaxID=4217 RepID=A0ACB9DMM5_ARCLA|nr:hypothetical protein L6452_10676 [Arctium lappa]
MCPVPLSYRAPIPCSAKSVRRKRRKKMTGKSLYTLSECLLVNPNNGESPPMASHFGFPEIHHHKSIR